MENKFKKAIDSSVTSIKKFVKESPKPELDLEKIKQISRDNWKDLKETVKQKTGKKEENVVLNVISTTNALKVFFYLMSVDGAIENSEMERFVAISNEICPALNGNVDTIALECNKQLEKVEDQDEFYDIVQDGVEAAVNDTVVSSESFMTPKILIWDMLTIAYSDGVFDKNERRLIKYVVRKYEIDSALYAQLEGSILTLNELEKELSWIKTTDKPYLVIESMVNEINDRKNVIFENVKSLII